MRPRWAIPFRLEALARPYAYTLFLPQCFKCSPTVNLDAGARPAMPSVRGAADAPRSPSGPRPPAGWEVAPLCPPSIGSALLYWWPEDGWQLGRVLRRSRQGPFSHVLRYRRPEAVFTDNVDTLQSASYGVRWVLLRPASEGPAPRSGLSLELVSLRAGKGRPRANLLRTIEKCHFGFG